MTRLYTAGIRREKVGIPQAMVIVDSKQAVSEDVFALHNHWRDWSTQFPEKPCDHMALIYPRIVGLRQRILSRFRETSIMRRVATPKWSSLKLVTFIIGA
jgi:hypothetical protein